MASDNKITNFKERFHFWDEYAVLLDRGIKLYWAMENGDVDGMAKGALAVFPTIVFIQECLGRYEFATRYINDGDVVLDIPCGTGYGSAILAATGANVIGVDIDEGTIVKCKDRYKYPNVTFEVGDMMADNLPAADVIVSFEGIEHVDASIAMPALYNALNDDGRFIASVPINELFITNGIQNPFHVTNYDLVMFKKLMESYFPVVLLFGLDPYGGITDLRNMWKGVVSVCWK